MGQLLEHTANGTAQNVALRAPLCHAATRRRAYHMARALSRIAMRSQDERWRGLTDVVKPLPNPALSATDARLALTATLSTPRRLMPLGARLIGWQLQANERDQISVVGAQRKLPPVGNDWKTPRRKLTRAEQSTRRKARIGIAPNNSFVRNIRQFRLPKFSAPKPLPSNRLDGSDGAQYSVQWHVTPKRNGTLIHTVSLGRWPVDPWQIDKHSFRRIDTMRYELDDDEFYWNRAQSRITTRLLVPITSLAQAAIRIGAIAPGNHCPRTSNWSAFQR